MSSTLVRGPSLAAAVSETGPLPAESAGWVVLGVARALAALHEAGLSHHAVSARNVVLGAPGPVLTDYAVSRSALVSGPGRAADDMLMLGTTACYAATGRLPWGAVTAPPPAAGTVPDDPELGGCPPWLAPIVAACLAPEPAQRPAAAQVRSWVADEIGDQPRSWLPDPVAARVTEYQVLPASSRGRFRWLWRGLAGERGTAPGRMGGGAVRRACCLASERRAVLRRRPGRAGPQLAGLARAGCGR